ncbi:MAG: UPF0280 family protein [Acidimicrobiales bacterium]
MDNGPQISELADGRIHVNHGPIDLLITIDASSVRRAAATNALRDVCHGLLDGLVMDLDRLRSEDQSGWIASGPTAKRMVDAAAAVSDLGFVTPMAAVAGSVAETVCDALWSGPSSPHGLDRVIVNNGGDIAFALADGATLDVALADVMTGELSRTVRVGSNDPVRGIATSGRHGRSFTLGIADSVTVLAETASVADVAATVIASTVDLPGSARVTRSEASDIDASSDLGDRKVVTEVLPLSRDEEQQALQPGLELAETLRARSTIVAAFLKLGQSAAVAMGAGQQALQVAESQAVGSDLA